MDNLLADVGPVFHALADPTRRAVVQQLSAGPLTVSRLAAPYRMTLPSFMKHIQVLEASGLVTSSKIGRVRTCTLEIAKLEAAEHWFLQQRVIWETRYKRLDQLLATMDECNSER